LGIDRHHLAQAVRDDLRAAGLPVCSGDDDPRVRSGACVSVDPAADEDWAVWVSWEPSPSLRQAAAEADASGRTEDPVRWHHGRVLVGMERAIVEILLSIGYPIAAEASEMDPFAVLVKGFPDPTERA
jgi:hypothetical protein